MDGTILNKKYNLGEKVAELVDDCEDLDERVTALENAPEPYNPSDYSTTEQKTGQKWIDGKDIYFRTFTGITLSTTSTWQDTGIDSSNMDTIISGIAIDDSKQSIGCSFGFGAQSTVILRAYISTNVIKTITLFYTKTPQAA